MIFLRDNLNGCSESRGNGLHRLQRDGIPSGLNAREVLLTYASPFRDKKKQPGIHMRG